MVVDMEDMVVEEEVMLAEVVGVAIVEEMPARLAGVWPHLRAVPLTGPRIPR